MPTQNKQDGEKPENETPEGEKPNEEKKDEKKTEEGSDRRSEAEKKLEAENSELKAKLKATNDENARRRHEQAEAEKKAKADEDARLAEQGKFKELSESQAKTIADLQKVVEESKPITTQLEKYKQVVKAYLDAEKKIVPDIYAPLLERLDPVEQLEWIAANKDKLAHTDGVPPTPNGKGNKKLNEAQEKTAREQAARGYQSNF